MFRRFFVCLSVALTLLCFVTSCKKDSTPIDNSHQTSSAKKTKKVNRKENLVIRDHKSEEQKVVTNDLNNNTEELNNDQQLLDNTIESEVENNIIYDIAEHLPEFNGGLNALNKYIEDHTNAIALSEKLKKSIRVMVSFIVEKDGALSNVEIAKSCNNSKLDTEAKNIVQEMPNWLPAKNDGVIVRMKYTVPVIFNPAH